MKKKSILDFLIVGAAKSGTTSIFNYLKIHPEIFEPQKKEAWFLQLAANPNKEILERIPDLPINIESYESLFDKKGNNEVVGEATPSYLIFPEYTIETLKRYYIDYRKIKIIIILREPIDKILSLYKFNLKIRTESLEINDALDNELERFNSQNKPIGLNYLKSSLYFEPVKMFLDNFDDVKILLFDDLKKNSKKVMLELAEFLEIESSFYQKFAPKIYNKTDRYKYNRGYNQVIKDFIANNRMLFSKISPPILKNKILQYSYSKINKDEISEENMKELKNVLRLDVKKLQELIDRDLSMWLKCYE